MRACVPLTLMEISWLRERSFIEWALRGHVSLWPSGGSIGFVRVSIFFVLVKGSHCKREKKKGPRDFLWAIYETPRFWGDSLKEPLLLLTDSRTKLMGGASFLPFRDPALLSFYLSRIVIVWTVKYVCIFSISRGEEIRCLECFRNYVTSKLQTLFSRKM